MSKMKELYTEINELIDTTNLFCEDIAEKLGCPISIVEDIVKERWKEQHKELLVGLKL
jgi:predicted XRE-type DNA-binding protein